MGMGGDDYSFCADCLENMTAEEFWRSFFTLEEQEWPPTIKENMKEAFNKGLSHGDIFCPKATHEITHKHRSRTDIERSKMSNSLRYKILRNDNFRCRACGATAKTDQLVVDHIKPISKGGKTIESNLRTLCYACNRGKGTRLE